MAGVLGVFGLGCGGGDDELRNGYVRVQLLRSESQASFPDEGTSRVIATLQYGECLSDFYADNPAQRQEGTVGAGDFGDGADGGEGWLDRLCDGSVEGTAPCEVVSIVQNVEVGRLTVTYDVEEFHDNSQVVFGPLPTVETAGCAAGLLPTVRVVSNDSLRGEDVEGNVIWNAASFDPLEVATGPNGVIRAHRGSPE